jgi:hypothetical protein
LFLPGRETGQVGTNYNLTLLNDKHSGAEQAKTPVASFPSGKHHYNPMCRFSTPGTEVPGYGRKVH